MGCGGAERVISLLANHWIGKGWKISIVTLGKPKDVIFYKLHPAVQVSNASFEVCPLIGWRRFVRYFTYIPRRIDYLRSMRDVLRQEIIRTEPDILISFLPIPNVRTIFSSYGLGIPVIISERNDPQNEYIPIAWRLLRWLAYPRAECLVAQTQRALGYFSKRVPKHSVVIPNPLVLEKSCTDLQTQIPISKRTHKKILAMGRLEYQKGFDLLISAFAQIAPKHPEWSLIIAGDGSQRQELEALISQLGLSQRINLPGVVTRTESAMLKSDIFVLSSRFEGFPNVLCEAMAFGLPVVSFDCPNGPKEIISPGVDGMLVPPNDVLALASAISQLIENQPERQRLGRQAKMIRDRLALPVISSKWEFMIMKAIGKRQKS